MKLYHNLIIEDSIVQADYYGKIRHLSRADIHNLVGFSEFWFIHDGKIILSFKNMLFDVMLDLASNFVSLTKGKITEGRLFTMDAEWAYHFSYVFKGNYCLINFSQQGKYEVTKDQFHSLITEFITYAFISIEYLYTDIILNKNYIELKLEINSLLKADI